MRDPLSRLDHFDEQDLPVHPLPAADVRRRGDRIRRRNAALVGAASVAAVVAVISPFAIASGRGPDRDVQPAPDIATVSPSIPAQSRTIPADFPLDGGMPTGTEGGAAGSGVATIEPCGRIGWSDGADAPVGPLDAIGASYADEGTTWTRSLVLFASASQAADALSELDTAVTACPIEEAPAATFEQWAVQPIDAGGDASLVVTERLVDDNSDPLGELTVYRLILVGDAVLVESTLQQGSDGSDEAIGDETARLRDASSETVSAMCLLPGSGGCAVPPESAGSREGSMGSTTEPGGPTPATSIPADFPLDQGLDRTSDTQVDGPSATARGVDEITLCGTRVWPTTGFTDRLGTVETGIEYSQGRDLVLFDSPEMAQAAFDAIESSVRACPTNRGAARDDDQTVRVVDTDITSGYPNLTVSVIYRSGLTGNAIYQFLVVGNSLVATSSIGEISAESAPDAAATLTDDNRQITGLFCVFSDDPGC